LAHISYRRIKYFYHHFVKDTIIIIIFNRVLVNTLEYTQLYDVDSLLFTEKSHVYEFKLRLSESIFPYLPSDRLEEEKHFDGEDLWTAAKRKGYISSTL
jgi:hypothetical protein